MGNNMVYSIGTIFVVGDKPALRICAKLGKLGEAWIDVDLPPDFYECIMKLAAAKIEEHEQLMKAELLAGDGK